MDINELPSGSCVEYESVENFKSPVVFRHLNGLPSNKRFLFTAGLVPVLLVII